MGEPQRSVGSTENGHVYFRALTVRNGILVSTLCAVREDLSSFRRRALGMYPAAYLRAFSSP